MPADSPRAWQVVLESIESDLLAGTLQPGDHLPPERALAASLGVGRSSVREAIRVLEVLGLIRTRTGSGPQAGAIVVATPDGGMSALMRLQVAANGFPISDIVKTRLLLETSTVSALATEIAAGSSSDLSKAEQLLDAMDSAALSEDEFLQLDAQFHVSLAEASGNLVVAAIMAGLRNSIESYVRAAVPRLASWAETCHRLRAEHRGILTAITAGEPEDAVAGIHAHITRYYLESGLGREAPPSGASAPQQEGTKHHG